MFNQIISKICELQTGNDTKLIQAEALRNARQLNQASEPYTETSPGVQWRDGQSSPHEQIQIGQNHDGSFPATQDGHPAQYVGDAESQPKPAPMCETPGCVKAASNILNQLDEVIDPCDNFYGISI